MQTADLEPLAFEPLIRQASYRISNPLVTKEDPLEVARFIYTTTHNVRHVLKLYLTDGSTPEFHEWTERDEIIAVTMPRCGRFSDVRIEMGSFKGVDGIALILAVRTPIQPRPFSCSYMLERIGNRP